MKFIFFNVLFGLIFCGAVCTHAAIYKYYAKEYSGIVNFQNEKKYNYFMFATFLILPLLLMGIFFVYPSDGMFVGTVIGLLSATLAVVFFDYRISVQKKEYVPLWREETIYEKSLLGILLLIFIVGLRYFNIDWFCIMNMLCIYIFCLKRIKKQHKILPVFETNMKKANFMSSFFNKFYDGICLLVLCVYVISMLFHVTYLSFDFYDADGCLDGGICKEGYVFNDCGGGKPCVVTKESCLQQHQVWLDDIQSCDLRHQKK